MIPRPLHSFVLALLVALTLAPVVLADSVDDEVRRIAHQLRCPICESVSVADSPADLAVQMRGVIRKKLEAGESEQRILDYFVTAYGDTVLLEPPRRGLGWAIWLGPVAALAIGLAILAGVLRIWVRRDQRTAESAATSSEAPLYDDSRAARVREELEAVRKGLGS